ncbi:expressed unknown protein [Seminavis robusta]|uniref:Uncharacterized protein n=1 Tax=Seminavis robusta TaxID=568900 RepID=A0A9N8ELA4_9STRA|nr:expressed unknown protein [Seminavis robusta]|eukprot:Sro1301_g260780.1 n/a (166) ;mRNA; f:5545-6104
MRVFILLLALLGFANGATYRAAPNYRKSAAAEANPSICDNFDALIHSDITVPAMIAAGFDMKNGMLKLNNGNDRQLNDDGAGRSLRSRGRRLGWENLIDLEAAANAAAIEILAGNAEFQECLQTDKDHPDFEVDIKIQRNNDGRRQLLDTTRSRVRSYHGDHHAA